VIKLKHVLMIFVVTTAIWICYDNIPSSVGWTAAPSDCLDVKKYSDSSLFIDSPGYYCLTRNRRVDGHYNLYASHVVSDSHDLFIIASDDVTLDLRGFKLTTDANLFNSGIKAPVGKEQLRFPDKPQVRNITIKNGLLLLERAGAGIQFAGYTNTSIPLPNTDATLDIYEARPDVGTLTEYLGAPIDESMKDFVTGKYKIISQTLPPGPLSYGNRKIVIENMRINADGTGVHVEGAGTVIRNNVIETNSGVGIWILGPNAVIENNTIIVHGRYLLERDYKHNTGDGAIRLRHGDGAIIRNNRIIFKDIASRRAVTTIDTGEFEFSGNTIEGAGNSKELVVSLKGEKKAKVTGTRIVE
jgi:Right handed beta helix region